MKNTRVRGDILRQDTAHSLASLLKMSLFQMPLNGFANANRLPGLY